MYRSLVILLALLVALPGCNKRKRKVTEPTDGGVTDGAFKPPADSAVLRFDTWVTPKQDGAPADVALPPDGAGPLPDLTLSGLTAKVNDSAVTYTVKVCNEGSAPAKAFYVDAYLHQATAPPPKTLGQAYSQQPQLAQGACVTVTLKLSNAPSGTHSSWARVDTDGAVTESDEGNNVVGPVTVTVAAKKPDLVVKQLQVDVKGSTKITVRYRLTLCNLGTGAAGATDAHVYFDAQAAPKPVTKGDASVLVPALGSGLCVTREVLRNDPPNGLYTSWARVDVMGAVAEANEGNNAAGPAIYPIWHKVPAKTCDDGCAFAITCKVFPTSSKPQCKTWCQGLTIPKRDCLLKAAGQADCAAFKKCNAPPPPPPPPPPAVCSDLCTYISSSCKKTGFYWTCYYACQAQTPTTLKCAQEAKLKKQCAQALKCMSLS